jgi:hypothetical protein
MSFWVHAEKIPREVIFKAYVIGSICKRSLTKWLSFSRALGAKKVISFSPGTNKTRGIDPYSLVNMPGPDHTLTGPRNQCHRWIRRQQ